MRRLFCLAAAILTAGPGFAAPPMLVATTAHFKIFSAEKPDMLRARAADLERYDAVLHHLTGTKDSGGETPLTVYVVTDQGDVGLGSNVLGYYLPSAAGPFAVVPGRLDGISVKSIPQIVLFHEYAHHFMLANFPALYSPWFVEGFAEFYSTTDLSGTTASVGRPEPLRIHTLTSSWSSPLVHLVAPGEKGLTVDQTDQLYARAWLLVHYLTLSKQRGGQIQDYLRIRSSGKSEAEAFQGAFHASIPDMDRELKTYFAGHQLPYVGLDMPTIGTVAIRPATPGEIAIAKLTPRLRGLQGDKAEATGPKSKIAERNAFQHYADQMAIDARVAVRKTPGDAALQELVAEAELVAGQSDEAVAAADEALRLSPDVHRARLVRAEVAMAQVPAGDPQRLVAPRRDIVAANQAAPDDPLPLIDYYRSFADHAVPVPAMAVRGLERAQQLAPQDGDIRIMLAKETIAAKNYAQAASLLRPVALSPHAGPERTAAQALLKSIPVEQEVAPPPIGDGKPAPDAPVKTDQPAKSDQPAAAG